MASYPGLFILMASFKSLLDEQRCFCERTKTFGVILACTEEVPQPDDRQPGFTVGNETIPEVAVQRTVEQKVFLIFVSVLVKPKVYTIFYT